MLREVLHRNVQIENNTMASVSVKSPNMRMSYTYILT